MTTFKTGLDTGGLQAKTGGRWHKDCFCIFEHIVLLPLNDFIIFFETNIFAHLFLPGWQHDVTKHHTKTIFLKFRHILQNFTKK